MCNLLRRNYGSILKLIAISPKGSPVKKKKRGKNVIQPFKKETEHHNNLIGVFFYFIYFFFSVCVVLLLSFVKHFFDKMHK